MDTSLQGRTAVVTGASLGLGLAMAQAFYRAGAKVALIARRAEPLATAKAQLEALTIEHRQTAQVATFCCDVAECEQVLATHGAIVERFGAVDILVNNAGKSSARPFMDITDDQWRDDVNLKLLAAVRLTRLVWPDMQSRRHGRIINVLNTFAKAPRPRSAPTSVTRAAGMALTKVLAGEGAPHNILVNAMLIGLIKSDQIRRAYDARQAGDSSQTFEEFVADAGARLPMKRMGEAHECANLALFLASDAASYVTGCAINMDGGMSHVV